MRTQEALDDDLCVARRVRVASIASVTVELLLSVTALAISRRARTFCAAERTLENLHAQSS